MITALYASLLTFLVIWLSLNVIRARRKYKYRIRYGDGDNIQLIIARATHSNTLEYIPITLILMLALELNHASARP